MCAGGGGCVWQRFSSLNRNTKKKKNERFVLSQLEGLPLGGPRLRNVETEEACRVGRKACLVLDVALQRHLRACTSEHKERKVNKWLGFPATPDPSVPTKPPSPNLNNRGRALEHVDPRDKRQLRPLGSRPERVLRLLQEFDEGRGGQMG